MKKCQGECKRLVEEYYLMSDGKILCYDCWARGLQMALQRATSAFNNLKENENRKNTVQEELEILNVKIDSAKNKTEGSYFSDIDHYADPAYIPDNYDEVMTLERKRELLRQERRTLEIRPSVLLSTGYYPTSYFRNGKFYTKLEAEVYEWSENMRLQAEIDNRKRLQEERINKINGGDFAEMEQAFVESLILVNDGRLTNTDVIVSVSRQTKDQRVLDILVNSENEEIRCAVAENPDINVKTLSILLSDKSMVVRDVAQSNPANLRHKKEAIIEQGQKDMLDYEKDIEVIEMVYREHSGYVPGWSSLVVFSIAVSAKDILTHLLLMKMDYNVRESLSRNPYISHKLLLELANDKTIRVTESMANNPDLPSDIRDAAKNTCENIRKMKKRYDKENGSQGIVHSKADRVKNASKHGCMLTAAILITTALTVFCLLL